MEITLDKFRQMISEVKPLEGDDMIKFMRHQSDISRRLQFELNSDFGRNTHIGKNVFINSCCHFQDQGGIYIGDNSAGAVVTKDVPADMIVGGVPAKIIKHI